jgi:hypothetical protein
VSNLFNLVELIRDTQAEIARAEQAIAEHGASLALELSTSSLRYRLEELEQQFADATAAEEIDVCSYRLIPGDPARYPIAAIGKAFTQFQTLITVLYDAIKKDQPRKRAAVSAESVFETMLDFAYSYSGSLGFVFSVPNDRMLVGESLLDMAMGAFMDLPRVESTESVSAFAKKYGTAPVRLAFLWAQAHLGAGLSVDVQWRRKNEVRRHMLLQVPELQRFVNLVASTGETQQESLRVYGELVGVDVLTRTFHFVVDSKTDIRGPLHQSFKAPEPLVVRSYYTATIVLETRLQYATGEEDKKYFLISLEASTPSVGGVSEPKSSDIGSSDTVDLE